MARLRSRPRWRLSLLATALAATAVTTGAGAGAAPPPPVDDGCAMPECYAALALNPRTGFFATVKNFPTEQAAHRQALGACRDQEAQDRRCTVLRVVAGERCLAGAMRMEDAAITEHVTAVRAQPRSVVAAALAELDGPEEQRHRIAGVCNG